MTISLLKDLTKLNIKDIEFEDLKNMRDSTGYDFSTIKLKAIVEIEGIENSEIELYIKIIRKDRIKESIFCYWNLLYDEKFKGFEESEFATIINKVRITETECEEYKHSILLEIIENNFGVLEYGSTIHLVKLEKYLNGKKTNTLIDEWKKYIEQGSKDVLFIGVINKKQHLDV